MDFEFVVVVQYLVRILCDLMKFVDHIHNHQCNDMRCNRKHGNVSQTHRVKERKYTRAPNAKGKRERERERQNSAKVDEHDHKYLKCV